MLLPIVRTWDEWAKLFTDVKRWTPAVREICRQAGVPARTIEAGFPGTNAVFLLDRTYVLKVYAPFCRHDFEIERALYPLLAAQPAIPAPQVLAQGVLRDRALWPYIMMNYLPGQPIREVRGQLSRRNLLDVASELGGMVRVLHRTPLTGLVAPEGPLQPWAWFLKQRRQRVVEQNCKQGTLPLSLLKAIPRFLTETLSAMPPAPDVLLNGDLTEDHILLEQRDGVWHVSALIDFADSLVGPSEYEWVALWFGGLACDAESWRAFMAAYDPDAALDAAFFRRALAFTFLHEFGAPIIGDTLEQARCSPPASLEELRAKLWG